MIVPKPNQAVITALVQLKTENQTQRNLEFSHIRFAEQCIANIYSGDGLLIDKE